MKFFASITGVALLTSSVVNAQFLGPYTKLQSLMNKEAETKLHSSNYDIEELYPAYNFEVPVDHFHNESKYEPHSSATYPLRYWFDARYWKSGGPVIVLACGETSGKNRLSFMEKGILHKLAKATNGLGVVLEHRYYGTSMPTANLSTENLRFLDTQQALADYAYFASNIQFPGLEWEDLTASATPWIVYGGSYAGSFAAFLRTLYPSVFWGAISSSGVPAAIEDYWQYWEAVRLYGPKKCISTTQDLVQVIDGILIHGKKKWKHQLKSLFGFPNVASDSDFAAALTVSGGVGSWQSRVWDPAVSTPLFDWYCGNITSATLLKPKNTKHLTKKVKKLIKKSKFVEATDDLVTKTLNWISFLNATVVQPCALNGLSQDECIGTNNATFWAQDDYPQYGWRSWTYQYCTQWGYFQTGSSIPLTIRPVVSRLLTLSLMQTPCKLAFGIKHVKPDIQSINQYGAFNISYPRLAFVDGQADPWKWAGVHAPDAPRRVDNVIEPWVEIEDAVHHWDEYGLSKNESCKGCVPKQVELAQDYEVAFVKLWDSEWRWRDKSGGDSASNASPKHEARPVAAMPDPRIQQNVLVAEEDYV